jgi:hypothetical protein
VSGKLDSETIGRAVALQLRFALNAVASITIDLSESQFQKLQELANTHGIPLEVFLKASLDDWLNSQKDDFVNAADYVLKKNTKLYRRLA